MSKGFTAGKTGTTRTITKESIISELKKNSLSFGWVLITLVFAAGFLFMMLNLSGLSSGFWVGLVTPMVAALAFLAFLWASHSISGNGGGVIIACVTAFILIALTILVIAFRVFGEINFGHFFMGLADFVILVGWIMILRLYACIINSSTFN